MEPSADSVTCLLYLQLLFTMVVPVVIGIACGVKVGMRVSVNDGFAISLGALFVVSVVLAFTTWYAAKWTLDRLTQVLLIVGSLACLTFAIFVSMQKGNHSYSGMSAILLAVNFAPACTIVYYKKQYNDINVKLLFHSIAKKLDNGTFTLDVLDESEPEKAKKHQENLDTILGEVGE